MKEQDSMELKSAIIVYKILKAFFKPFWLPKSYSLFTFGQKKESESMQLAKHTAIATLNWHIGKSRNKVYKALQIKSIFVRKMTFISLDTGSHYGFSTVSFILFTTVYNPSLKIIGHVEKISLARM